MVFKEEIAHIEMLNQDTVSMVLKSERLALLSKPGQFLNFRCGDSYEAYLRRPISICDANTEFGTVTAVFQVRGAGTSRLAKLKAGDCADVMGPLGTGFKKAEAEGSIVVVGGGIGLFPLLFLLKSFKDAERITLLGFRSQSQVVLEKEFTNVSERIEISTDDGSYGICGRATDLLKEVLAHKKIACVYTCGPEIMMKNVVEQCLELNVAVQVSMEQRMACGVGACLVCACKVNSSSGKYATVKSVSDSSDMDSCTLAPYRHDEKTCDHLISNSIVSSAEYSYTHVCKDGPVFDGRDILF